MRLKITSILFLLALLAPPMITFYWLQHQKSGVRHEVKQMMIRGIDREKLVLISLTREESLTKLRWEHPGEFEYREQMYDIVETRTIGDSVYYWCWWDNEETRLNRQLEELVVKNLNADPVKQDRQDRLNSYFKSLYCSDILRTNPVLPCIELKKNSVYSVSFCSLSISPPSPPPRRG